MTTMSRRFGEAPPYNACVPQAQAGRLLTRPGASLRVGSTQEGRDKAVTLCTLRATTASPDARRPCIRRAGRGPRVHYSTRKQAGKQEPFC